METYALLLKEETLLPAPALASDLTDVVNRPIGELTRQFKERPWILLEDLPAANLDPVFAILAKHNVGAKAIPEAHMPILPEAWRVKVADPTPESFFLEFAEPPSPPVLRWEKLEVVSGGLVTLSVEDEARIYGGWAGEKQSGGVMGPSGLTPGALPAGTTRRNVREPLLVDLFSGGQKPFRLRIDAGNFKYDYLGDRMATGSRENLRTLLSDIRKRAPHARFSERTERLMAGEPAVGYRFRSLAGFKAYHRWVIQAFEEEPPDSEAS